MELQEFTFIIIFTSIALLAGALLFLRCKCSSSSSSSNSSSSSGSGSSSSSSSSGGDPKKGKHKKQQKQIINKSHKHKIPDAHLPATPISRELFVSFIHGVNKSVDCIAIDPHTHLIATTTADGRVHAALGRESSYFFNFREENFSAIDFCCKQTQTEGRAELLAAMATSGRMVCFSIHYQDNKITGIHEVRRSPHPLQKGPVKYLVASKGPWVISSSEGDDTSIRIHSYSGELLASVDTKQIQNLQLAVTQDGRFFGCAAWSPGVKIFEVKAKEGNFQRVEKAIDVRSSQGLLAFGVSRHLSVVCLLCKSGKLSLWNTAIRYEAGEDPKLIAEQSLPVNPNAKTSLHFLGDAAAVAVCNGDRVLFVSCPSLSLYKTFTLPEPVENFLLAPNNKFLIIAPRGHRPEIWRLPLPELENPKP